MHLLGVDSTPLGMFFFCQVIFQNSDFLDQHVNVFDLSNWNEYVYTTFTFYYDFLLIGKFIYRGSKVQKLLKDMMVIDFFE